MQIYIALKKRIFQMATMREYIERRMKLLPRVIMPLNKTGVKLDRGLQQKLLTDHRRKVRNWRKDVEKHFDVCGLGDPPLGAKGGFSNKKMAELLYEKLKLPTQHHPKDGHVTVDRKSLKTLAKIDKTGTVAKLLIRSEAKTVETAIKAKADPDGRVRSRFVFGGDEKSSKNETGKESPGTGRLASRDPNLQNVKEWARMMYIPTRKSGWILKADFSQIEYRLTAEMSGDQQLKLALKDDAYLKVMFLLDRTSNIYGLHKRGWQRLLRQYEAGKPEVVIARDECKRIALGWSYRMGAKKLENVKGVPFKVGQIALKDLSDIFWGVTEWWDELMTEVKQSAGGADWGFLTLPWGRRRYFTLEDVPKICNFKSQGCAAEVLYDAMEILIPNTPKRFPGTKVVLTVHDEVVFDVHPSTNVEELAVWITQIMEHPIPELSGLVIPVDIRVGRNWAKKHVCDHEGCQIPNNPEGTMKLEDWRQQYE